MESMSNRVEECETCGRTFNVNVNNGSCPACAASRKVEKRSS